MEQQRERARASWKGAEKSAVVPAYQKLLEQGRTKFLGYRGLEATSRVIGLLVDKQPVDSVPAGTKAELVLDQTPFYAEAGRTGGRSRVLCTRRGEKVADVETAFPGVPGLTVHRIVTHAAIAVGDTLRAEVAVPLRDATRRNHTATHLLHASLRHGARPHVKQAGSVVDPGRLRFDFTLTPPGSRGARSERLMNEQILHEHRGADRHPAARAGHRDRRHGAVRRKVRRAGSRGYRARLQPRALRRHARQRTGDIGIFKIVYEGSISAGVRRIEAITGEGALHQYQESTDAVKRIAGLMKASEPDLFEHVERMLAEQRALERQVDQLKTKVAQSAVGSLEAQAHSVNGSRVLAARVDGMDRQQMRALADSLRNKWKSAVVVLASVVEGGRCGNRRCGDEGLDGESSRRKTGGRGGAGGRRQRRRTPRYGGGRRQGCGGARRGAGGGLQGRREQASGETCDVLSSSARDRPVWPAASSCRIAGSKPFWWRRGAW